MKRFLAAMLVLLMLATGCAEEDPTVRAANTILDCLVSGDCAAIMEMLSDEVRAAVSVEALQGAWAQTAALGALKDAETVPDQGFAVTNLTFEQGRMQMIVGLDGDGAVQTLLLRPVTEAPAAERELPEGATARSVKLFEGTDWELNAEIISPAVENGVYAVLIHGSGPSDLDETAGGCKPFRDLAYDLAANGVGTLRFDKITYAHPELGAETVTEEYLEPVREALRVLKEQADVRRAVAVGHSEGGMLMPWLVAECGFDGGVALAGTPRTLWEVSYAQNLAVLDTLTGEQRDAAEAQIAAERERAENLDALDDGETLFGVPVKYQRSIAELDEIALALDAGVPMLFLWGEADFQIGREDFDAWKEGLGESEQFTFISYLGLNHLFMQAQEGDDLSNAAEVYARQAQMDPRVAADIAAWLAD